MEARLLQQMTQYVPRAHEGLTCPIETLFNMEGQQSQGKLISCEGPRGLRPEAMFKQGRRRYCWCWHRWCFGVSVDLCQQRVYRLAPFFLMFTGPSCPSVARVEVLGEGRAHT